MLMYQTILSFFGTNGFMPHGFCLMWKPLVFWLTLVSHAVITLSYFVIPFALLLLLRLRKDLQFRWIFILFGAFILLCGLTHLLALVTLYLPIYGVSSLILTATAVVSFLTSILIWPQIPILVKIPAPWALEEKNAELLRSNQQLMQAEEMSRSIIEAAPDAIIMVSQSGEILQANKRASMVFGYAQGALIGKPLEILLPERFKSKHSAHRKNYFGNPHTRDMGADLSLFALNSQGKEFPVEISLSPMSYNDNLVGLASIRDVTSKKRVEQKLEHTKQLECLNDKLTQQKAELLRSNEELNNFSHLASHDLREPLRGMQNYANFLLEDYGDKLDKEGKKKLTTLCRLSSHLDTLIDTLLEYSRLGRVEMAYEKTPMKKLIDRVVLNLEATLNIANCSVKVQEPFPSITCDKVRIAEVFHNLISNAIKYNDSAQKQITVGYSQENNAFFVKDNGIGVPENLQEEIFAIFKRLHAKDKYGGGTGSGLTFVKKIIERHHGKVWHEQNTPRGSCFYFTIPEINS